MSATDYLKEAMTLIIGIFVGSISLHTALTFIIAEDHATDYGQIKLFLFIFSVIPSLTFFIFYRYATRVKHFKHEQSFVILILLASLVLNITFICFDFYEWYWPVLPLLVLVGVYTYVIFNNGYNSSSIKLSRAFFFVIMILGCIVFFSNASTYFTDISNNQLEELDRNILSI